ncbi:hypothetical protein [Egicoccus halophilus]|nr:hypothetical protein [Egicoccus halophilus]
MSSSPASATARSSSNLTAMLSMLCEDWHPEGASVAVDWLA